MYVIFIHRYIEKLTEYKIRYKDKFSIWIFMWEIDWLNVYRILKRIHDDNLTFSQIKWLIIFWIYWKII